MAEESIPASTDPIIESNTTQDEVQEQSTQPEGEGQKKPVSYAGTKHKLKIDDQEEEIEYEELLKQAQKAKASDKRFREAAQLRQQVDEVLKNLKSGDHQNLVKLLGKDSAKQLAEKLLLEEIEYEELPEHEKTIRQLQREKEEAEKKLKEQETQKQTLERQKLEREAGERIEKDMIAAVTESGIKPNPRVFARMAEIMEAYHHKTKQMMPAKEALKLVRGDIPNDFTAYVDGLADEGLNDLVKQLPKKLLDAVRKQAVESVLSQTSVTKRTTDETPTPQRSKNPNRGSTQNWFEQMEKRLGG